MDEPRNTEPRSSSTEHLPVMLRETLELLRPRSGCRYADGTLGGGGHAEELLKASAPDGELLAVDWDADARSRASVRLARFGPRLHVRDATYAELGDCFSDLGWDGADGILVDLGVSSFHLDLPERGFSFARSGPLDMRMDQRRPLTAARYLHEVEERELVRVLRDYGEEPRARAVARAILAAERRGELRDTLALAAVVSRVVRPVPGRHPATRTFQALRIAVNGELEVLERFLKDAYRWLRPGGRLVMLAYHSLEDRLVKEAFRLWARSCVCPRTMPVCRCGWSKKAALLTRRPLRPSDAEVEQNPRSRSARLRAVERLAA